MNSPAYPVSDCILISGASRGLGAALAEVLSRDGVMLILLGRDEAALSEVAQRCRVNGAVCRIAPCDLTDDTALHALERALKADGLHPNLVISCAGVLEGRAKGDIVESGEVASSVLSLNLGGAINLAWLFLPRMVEQGRGHVLFISSLAAFAPLADAAAYSASKAGLLSYGLSLRASLAGSGVTVQVACPGYIETGMGQRHVGARPGEYTAPQAARAVLRGIRRGRAVFGFPFLLFHLARLSQLAPEWVQRWAGGRLRFHVDPEGEG